MNADVLTTKVADGIAVITLPSLDVAALAAFAVVGLVAAAPLLAREGGVTRTAFRERR